MIRPCTLATFRLRHTRVYLPVLATGEAPGGLRSEPADGVAVVGDHDGSIIPGDEEEIDQVAVRVGEQRPHAYRAVRRFGALEDARQAVLQPEGHCFSVHQNPPVLVELGGAWPLIALRSLGERLCHSHVLGLALCDHLGPDIRVEDLVELSGSSRCSASISRGLPFDR